MLLDKTWLCCEFGRHFNECVYFSHGVQRDHILCYFDKETGFGSVDLSVFGTGICKTAVVEHYKLVFDCV